MLTFQKFPFFPLALKTKETCTFLQKDSDYSPSHTRTHMQKLDTSFQIVILTKSYTLKVLELC